MSCLGSWLDIIVIWYIVDVVGGRINKYSIIIVHVEIV